MAVVVSGPIARAVGMNAGHSVLGPGNRPNATIGRTLRLLAITTLEMRPGLMDAASIGRKLPVRAVRGNDVVDLEVTPAEG